MNQAATSLARILSEAVFAVLPALPYAPKETTACDGQAVMARGLGASARPDGPVAFQDATFAIPCGCRTALIGPNGSGKSTLLRVLAGLGRAEAGTLRWNGEDALADRTTHATRVAYLGHQDAVKPGLTAAENLAFWGTPTEIEAALARVNLAPLAALPARIAELEQEQADLTAQLGDPALYKDGPAKARDLQDRLDAAEKAHAAAVARWLELEG